MTETKGAVEQTLREKNRCFNKLRYGQIAH